MLRNRKGGVFALLVVMLMMAVSVAMPLAAVAGPKADLGNSAAAKMCQKDGWMELAPAESQFVAFTSEEECVSYAATGGTIYPLQVQVSTFTLQVSGVYGSINGSGLMPNAPVMAYYRYLEEYSGLEFEHQWDAPASVSPDGTVTGGSVYVSCMIAEMYFWTTDVNGTRIETNHFHGTGCS